MSVCLRLDLRSQLREREREGKQEEISSQHFFEKTINTNNNISRWLIILTRTYLHTYLLPTYIPTYYLATTDLPTTYSL